MQPLSYCRAEICAVVQIISSSKIQTVICLTAFRATHPVESVGVLIWFLTTAEKFIYVVQLPLTQTWELSCCLESVVCRLPSVVCAAYLHLSWVDFLAKTRTSPTLRHIDISQRISHWSRSTPSATSASRAEMCTECAEHWRGSAQWQVVHVFMFLAYMNLKYLGKLRRFDMCNTQLKSFLSPHAHMTVGSWLPTGPHSGLADL